MMILKVHPITCIATNSSLLEIRTWPKPGNVHKTHNFSTTTYSDFLKVGYASAYFWENMINEINRTEQPLSTLYVSQLFNATKMMMNIQSGGNVLLGHFMLILPVVISSAMCNQRKIRDLSKLWEYTQKILQNSTVNDTIILYQALRTAQPGGMGIREKYDIFSDNYKEQLENDNITLAKIFDMSQEYDGISKELITNYEFIRETVISKIEQYIMDYEDLSLIFPRQCTQTLIQRDVIEISQDLNELLIRVYLFILSEKADTLIRRKTSLSKSEQISKRAQDLLEKYNHKSKHEWTKKVHDFDVFLQNGNGKLNPGTTADLLACSLCIYMIKTNFFSSD
jgi:triphosphoribosyl-dephospho-CoA synthase